MKLTWDNEKNEELKRTPGRRICFEDVAAAIDSKGLVDILRHHNRERYGNQVILVVEIDDYICAAPAVRTEGGYFLKTAFRDRKLHARYRRGERK